MVLWSDMFVFLIFVFESWRTKKPKVWPDERNPLYGLFSARMDVHVVATGAEATILKREATVTLGVSVVHSPLQQHPPLIAVTAKTVLAHVQAVTKQMKMYCTCR